MQNIEKAWCVLIDITNICHRGCVYCTRYDRHTGHQKFHMPLEQVEAALKAYRGFPRYIGIIGGEPQFYQNFDDLCKLLQRYYNRNKYILFTSIDPQRVHNASLVSATFGHVAFHAHTKAQEEIYEHQPITIAIRDAVPDEKLKNELISDCWVQRKWCPTVTDDGAFFCEVGAALAKLQGIKGWPFYDDDKRVWWRKSPAEFGDQLELCQLCGMAIPMKRQKMIDRCQKISPSFLEMLKRNKLPIGDYELFDQIISVKEMKEALPNWTPGTYKISQLREHFCYSTINWNQYE